MKARLLCTMLLMPVLGGCLLTRSDELKADADQCRAYGFRDGTPEMANCRMRQDQQRQAAVGAAIQQMNQNNQRPEVNCTTRTFGSQTDTTCR